MIATLVKIKNAPLSLLLLFVGIAILIGTISPELGGDGDARLRIVEAILRGSDIPKSKYSVIQPILSLPLAIVGRFFEYSVHESIRYFNLLVLLVLGAAIFRRIELVRGVAYSADFSLLLLSASMLHVNISFYYGEVLTAFCLVLAFLVFERQSIVAATLVAIGVANTPAVGPAVLVAAIALRRKSWPLLVGLGFAFAIFCAENFLKYGGLLESEYFSQSEKGLRTILPYSGQPGFSYPSLFGVLSILFSFGKGLLFFIPALVLVLKLDFLSLFNAKSNKRLCVALFSFSLVLVYSKWWAWYGGVFWGPRFFLVLIFLGAYFLAEELAKNHDVIHKIVLAGVLTLSTWVGMASMAFRDYDISPLCEANGYMYESLCWYVPEFSPLWRPFVELGATGVIERLTDHRVHSYAIWQIIVFIYFLHKIAFSGYSVSIADGKENDK